MKIATAIILLLADISAVPAMPENYTLLCEGTKATGFNWRNGSFEETRFKPARYLVTSRPENGCAETRGPQPVVSVMGVDWFFQRKICLNIREFGEEYRPALSDDCTEYYVKRDGGFWNRTFDCKGLFSNIKGEFNGHFRRFSDTTVGANPKDDYRDSLLIEVGKCSVIS